MRLNRRSFLKLLGKATVASGVAVVITSLPDEAYPGLDSIIDNSEPGILSIDEYAKLMGIRLPQSLPSDIWGSGWTPEKTAGWNGDVWTGLTSTNLEVRELTIDDDGMLYAGGEFTSL